MWFVPLSADAIPHTFPCRQIKQYNKIKILRFKGQKISLLPQSFFILLHILVDCNPYFQEKSPTKISQFCDELFYLLLAVVIVWVLNGITITVALIVRRLIKAGDSKIL